MLITVIRPIIECVLNIFSKKTTPYETLVNFSLKKAEEWPVYAFVSGGLFSGSAGWDEFSFDCNLVTVHLTRHKQPPMPETICTVVLKRLDFFSTVCQRLLFLPYVFPPSLLYF